MRCEQAVPRQRPRRLTKLLEAERGDDGEQSQARLLEEQARQVRQSHRALADDNRRDGLLACDEQLIVMN